MISQLEFNLKEYMKEVDAVFNQKKMKIENEIAPMLPIVILFCNKKYEKKVDIKYINKLFDTENSRSYNVTEEELPDFEVVNALAQRAFEVDGARLNKALLLCNANEEGFKTTRLMGYFNYQYIVNNAYELTLLQNALNAADDHKSAQDYAHGLEDKLCEIFNDMHEDFGYAGISTDAMYEALAPINAVKNADDLLGTAISKIIDNFRRV